MYPRNLNNKSRVKKKNTVTVTMLYTHVFFTTLSSGANDEYMKDHIFELWRKIIISCGLVTVIRMEKLGKYVTKRIRDVKTIKS